MTGFSVLQVVDLCEYTGHDDHAEATSLALTLCLLMMSGDTVVEVMLLSLGSLLNPPQRGPSPDHTLQNHETKLSELT